MATTITSKGQVTIPKHIRDALQLEPGSSVDFAVNREGEVVLQRAKQTSGAQECRRPLCRRTRSRRSEMANPRPDEAAARRAVMLIVDTNVLVDVLEDDPDWADWSIGQLRAQAQVHELAINAIIYAELSLAFATVEALDAVVDQMRLTVADVPRPALFLAGQAFLRYRRAGGVKSNVLSDFFIGAHAAVARCPLLTRDVQRYRAYFPTVELIAPLARSELTFLNSRWFAPSSGPA